MNMELNSSNLDTNLDPSEKEILDTFATAVHSAIRELPAPHDSEDIARLLELYADQVREGEI